MNDQTQHTPSDWRSPEVVWLQPWCSECERYNRPEEGRTWCSDDAWGKCEECDALPVKYMLAASAPAEPGEEEIERAITAWAARLYTTVPCPTCNGSGAEYVDHEPDWCPTCGGAAMISDINEREAMRAAIKAAQTQHPSAVQRSEDADG